MISKEALEKVLMSIAGATNALLIVIITYLLKNEHILVSATISVLSSSIFSWGLIFFALRAIIIFIMHRIKSEYFVGTGIWFCIYYNEYFPAKYMRIGTLKLKQVLDEVKMLNLETRDAIIDKQQSRVYGFYGTDPHMDASPQRVSTGKGKYNIDFELAAMKGFFEMKNDRNNYGVNTLTIEKQNINKYPQKIEGVFLNAHYKQNKPQRPATGIVMLFKDRCQAEEFIIHLIIASQMSDSK